MYVRKKQADSNIDCHEIRILTNRQAARHIADKLRRIRKFPSINWCSIECSCLQRGGEVAREEGASQQAIARFQQAYVLLKESPFQSELFELQALLELAESYRVAGQFSQSSAAFQ
jgi:hypothetical protein